MEVTSNTYAQEKKFLTATDVSDILGVSISMAYKVIKDLNTELKADGKIVIAGKVSKRYFETKVVM